ncbi:MAG: acylphosphatase [Candidatus Portnoybacteria bacterium]
MFAFFKKEENNKEYIRARILALGRVQGVMFRENCQKKAVSLGVSGWVKNLKDGRVEAIFEGEKDKVEKMVNWSRRGPIWAKVDSFDVVWEDYQNEFPDFEIRYDLLI